MVAGWLRFVDVADVPVYDGADVVLFYDGAGVVLVDDGADVVLVDDVDVVLGADVDVAVLSLLQITR